MSFQGFFRSLLEYAAGECVPVMAVFGMTEEHLNYAH
jgi:hypothetical protein